MKEKLPNAAGMEVHFGNFVLLMIVDFLELDDGILACERLADGMFRIRHVDSGRSFQFSQEGVDVPETLVDAARKIITG